MNTSIERAHAAVHAAVDWIQEISSSPHLRPLATQDVYAMLLKVRCVRSMPADLRYGKCRPPSHAHPRAWPKIKLGKMPARYGQKRNCLREKYQSLIPKGDVHEIVSTPHLPPRHHTHTHLNINTHAGGRSPSHNEGQWCEALRTSVSFCHRRSDCTSAWVNVWVRDGPIFRWVDEAEGR